MRSVLLLTMSALIVALLSMAIAAQEQADYIPPQITTIPQLTPPAEALAHKLGGTVRVKVAIDARGDVTAVESVSGPDGVCAHVTRPDVVAMRSSASAAAMTAKFTPASVKGKPVTSSTWLNFKFPGREERTEYAAAAAARRLDPNQTPGSGNLGSAANPPPPDYRGPVTTVPPQVSSPKTHPSQISGGVLNGKALSLPKPPYPPAARAVRASGAVSIQVLIDENGDVFSVQAVSGHPLLRAASATAACGARFSPTQLMGNPVKVSGVITYNFVP